MTFEQYDELKFLKELARLLAKGDPVGVGHHVLIQ